MPKSNTLSSQLINNVFLQTAFPWEEEQNLYISLHTSNPAGGNQSTGEVSYTGYNRMFVDRSASGWVVSQAASGKWKAHNSTEIAFPIAQSNATVTHVGVGTSASGAGTLLYVGTIASGNISIGSIPKILAAQLVIQED